MADPCVSNKIDSNISGLRYAEERCIKELAYETEGEAAEGSFTVDANPAALETVTLGARVYTFVTTLSAANQVLIGATPAATADNLTRAINASAGAGTNYGTGTVAHADVTARAELAVVWLTAKLVGTAGNGIVTSSTDVDVVAANGTLLGGQAPTATTPVFHLLEPNSYNDFGGEIATVARNPINPSRQRKKGVTVDVDASGGFEQDLTFSNLTRLMQGFMFADIRQKPSSQPLNDEANTVTGVAGSTYTLNEAPPIFPGSMVFASGFAVSANNGLKRVTGRTGETIVVAETLAAEASPPATAKLEAVGFQFAAGDAVLTMNGSLVRMGTTVADLTTLGLIPGEWVYLGGDTAATQFGGGNMGFARISTIAAGLIEFDKVSFAPTADAGTGKTLQMYFGNVIKNESDPVLIKRRSYQIERTLGTDDNGTMSEYLVGAVPNEFTLNIPQADKVTAGLSFVAVDNEQRTGAEGLKSGTRPTASTPEPEDAYNTSNDIRVKLSIADPALAAPAPLFAFATELTLTINNNVSPNKAIGVMGAFDTTAGTFEVGGSLTAYFANIQAARAVRNNEDVTIDLILARDNRALLFDIPLLSLGDGRLDVAPNEPITLPLDTNAAESKFGHTLLFQSFPYLPSIAI